MAVSDPQDTFSYANSFPPILELLFADLVRFEPSAGELYVIYS